MHFPPQVFPETEGKPPVALNRVDAVFGQLLSPAGRKLQLDPEDGSFFVVVVISNKRYRQTHTGPFNCPV